MGIVVQKYGGSSVSNIDNLNKVCKHIIKKYNEGNSMAVVVSAQGKMTDSLISQEKEITTNPSKREHDVLVSVGEQISVAKLVMCLNKLGYKAISLLGWQLPIITNDNYGDATIVNIDVKKIINAFNDNQIVIIPGFQGITSNGDMTTLGRGGSDTTAVALSAYLHADETYIYTDVDGVYSDDPKINPLAIKYDKLSYEQMLKMANNGAKVLHNKCVELAQKNNISLIVKSTFGDGTGTLIE